MRLMSKGKYVIVPKGMKFTGSGKLGLTCGKLSLSDYQLIRTQSIKIWTCPCCLFYELPWYVEEEYVDLTPETCLDDSLSIASNIRYLQGLKILNLNIQSLFYKIDEIKLMVLESGADILGIIETWLHDGIDNSEIHIPNYTLCCNDHVDGYFGVAFHIHNRIETNLISLYQPEPSKAETLWLKVSLPNTRLFSVKSPNSVWLLEHLPKSCVLAISTATLWSPLNGNGKNYVPSCVLINYLLSSPVWPMSLNFQKHVLIMSGPLFLKYMFTMVLLPMIE